MNQSGDRGCIVVTGAARGIGLAITRNLAAANHRVVAIDRDAAVLASLTDTIPLTVAAAGDVRDPATFDRADECARELGGLTGWVNNAGVVRLRPLHDMDREALDTVLDVNLKSVLVGCQVALRSFLRDGTAGSIVNISSIHGRFGFPGYAVYDTAKGGVEAVTRSICVEYGHLGIRCNAVAPGAVDTTIVPDAGADAVELNAQLLATRVMSPMRRISAAEEIAEVVSFLLSDRATSINGHVLAVDNGMSAHAATFDPDPTIRFG